MNNNKQLDSDFESKLKLERLIAKAKIPQISKVEEDYANTIISNAYKQKGVWTVIVTLLFYKTLEPSQDIRYHQVKLKNGFSGRSFDTKIITPTLRKLELPCMAESGWLTRSLEQPHPYTLDYQGKISNKELKNAFLNILDIVQKCNTNQNGAKKARDFLEFLFVKIKQEQKLHQVKIIPLKNKDKITINQIITMLKAHFEHSYKTHGASKLPVLAFYAIYKILIKELKRYENCILGDLGALTASDRTSKSAGDIEIFKNKKIYEAIEIKFGREIDINILDIAYSKINKFSPKRYSIFSTAGIKESDVSLIFEKIEKIRQEHGCQIIINGVLPSIKYYLRLITDLSAFIKNYSKLIEQDKELQKEHKEFWNKILLKQQVDKNPR